MPTQTNEGQHPEDEKETLIKIEGGGLAPGEQKIGYGSDQLHAVIRQQ